MKKSNQAVVSFPAIRTSKTDLLILWSLAVLGSTEAIDLFLRGVAVILKKWTWKSDDAFQCALIGVWKHYKEYNPSKSPLSSWLKWQTRAGWQEAKRQGTTDVLFSMLDTTEGEYVEQIPSLDKEVQIAEEISAITEVLDEERINILSMYFIDGMTFQEVAEKLGCSVPTARNRVLSIVNLCRSHFGTKGRVEGLTKNGMTVVH